MWSEENKERMRARLASYVKNGQLFRLRQGIYSTSQKYNHFELACKIFSPSYVSFESVLFQQGIIFQPPGEVTVASYLSRQLSVDDVNYSFRKIKPSVLLLPFGIQQENGASVACAERAFLDTLYHYGDYEFATLHSLDKQKIFEYLPFYQNKRLERTVFRLFERMES